MTTIPHPGPTLTEADRPAMPRIYPENIPEQMRQLPQWVNWRWGLDRSGTRFTKVPALSSAPHRNASHSDPGTWTTYDAALATHLAQPDRYGLMVAMGNGLFGIDMDRPVEQVVYETFIEQFDTYAEVSPSGIGIHVYLLGTVPDGLGSVVRKKENVELYGEKRFLTVTGRRLDGHPVHVNAAGPLFQSFYDTYLKAPEVVLRVYVQREGGFTTLTNSPLEAAAEKFGPAKLATFHDLWYGQGRGGSEHSLPGDTVDLSTRDWNLMRLLCIIYERDAHLMEQAFCQSHCYRSKYHPGKRSGNFLQQQIDLVIQTSRD